MGVLYIRKARLLAPCMLWSKINFNGALKNTLVLLNEQGNLEIFPSRLTKTAQRWHLFWKYSYTFFCFFYKNIKNFWSLWMFLTCSYFFDVWSLMFLYSLFLWKKKRVFTLEDAIIAAIPTGQKQNMHVSIDKAM